MRRKGHWQEARVGNRVWWDGRGGEHRARQGAGRLLLDALRSVPARAAVRQIVFVAVIGERQRALAIRALETLDVVDLLARLQFLGGVDAAVTDRAHGNASESRARGGGSASRARKHLHARSKRRCGRCRKT